MSGLHVLVDIGGTNARFALAQDGLPVDIRVYPTASISSLAQTTQAYLSDVKAPGSIGHGSKGQGSLSKLSVAAAGPVSGAAGARQIDWPVGPQIRQADLSRDLACGTVLLMNDFAAQALALPWLEGGDLVRLGAGGEAVAGGPRAVLGPGTGLGVAGLVEVERADGSFYALPLIGEGGHGDLAASNDEEMVLLKIFQDRFGHVSADRVLSGPGLVALYTALLALRGEDFVDFSAAEIVLAAKAEGPQKKADEAALHAIHLLSAWLGSVAGNAALTFGATQGVYISGGVIPALGSLFDEDVFRARFEAKGRLSFYTKAIPTWLVTRPHPALLGMARGD